MLGRFVDPAALEVRYFLAKFIMSFSSCSFILRSRLSWTALCLYSCTSAGLLPVLGRTTAYCSVEGTYIKVLLCFYFSRSRWMNYLSF
jgi:hypothetical protein